MSPISSSLFRSQTSTRPNHPHTQSIKPRSLNRLRPSFKSVSRDSSLATPSFYVGPFPATFLPRAHSRRTPINRLILADALNFQLSTVNFSITPLFSALPYKTRLSPLATALTFLKGGVGVHSSSPTLRSGGRPISSHQSHLSVLCVSVATSVNFSSADTPFPPNLKPSTSNLEFLAAIGECAPAFAADGAGVVDSVRQKTRRKWRCAISP